MAPKQKEWVINAIKSHGYCTLMCGDGTNDVGALKHAHVGVAILSHCPEWVERRQKLLQEITEKQQQSQNGAEAAGVVPTGGRLPPPVRAAGPGRAVNRRSPAVTGAPRPDASFERQMAKLMKELDEQDKANVVKLGDASIAAPFSSKMSSIECSKTKMLIKIELLILITFLCASSSARDQTGQMYFGE